MIEIPYWVQILGVIWQAVGLWKAGDGWKYGWIIAATQSAGWGLFSVFTRQWLLLAAPIIMSLVKIRNFNIAKKSET